MGMSEGMKGGLASGIGSAGSSLLGGLFGWIGQKKQREYEKSMYSRQLADSRENWNLENLYNSPAQQMQRLKDAGLNPNLVYGNGATATGGNINSTDAHVSDISHAYDKFADVAKAPLSAIDTMYDLRQRSAQTDLTNEQIRSQIQLQKMQAATTALTALEATGQGIKNEYAGQTARATIANLLVDLDVKHSEVRTQEVSRQKMSTETDIMLDKNMREWASNRMSLKEVAANIKLTEANTRLSGAHLGLTQAQTAETKQKNLTEVQTTQLAEIENALQKGGYSKNDNGVQRVIKIAIQTILGGGKISIDWIKKQLGENRMKKFQPRENSFHSYKHK